MPTKRSRRGRTGRGRQGGGRGGGNLALSLFDSMGRQFATRGDRITLKAKLYLQFGASGSVQTYNLNAANLGPRVAAVLAQYLRWRIVKMVSRIDLISSGASAVISGIAPSAVAFMDDFSGEGGSVPVPTTTDGILALRCSAVVSTTAPSMLQFDPVDKTRWYYTAVGASGDDSRFIIQSSLLVGPIATSGILGFSTYFVIEAIGAVAASGT